MPTTTDATLTESLRVTAHRLTGASQDYDPLMDRIGNARFVLLGEASHGTHEFYHERAQITQRLIEEKGFTAVGLLRFFTRKLFSTAKSWSLPSLSCKQSRCFTVFPGRLGHIGVSIFSR